MAFHWGTQPFDGDRLNSERTESISSTNGWVAGDDLPSSHSYSPIDQLNGAVHAPRSASRPDMVHYSSLPSPGLAHSGATSQDDFPASILEAAKVSETKKSLVSEMLGLFGDKLSSTDIRVVLEEQGYDRRASLRVLKLLVARKGFGKQLPNTVQHDATVGGTNMPTDDDDDDDDDPEDHYQYAPLGRGPPPQPPMYSALPDDFLCPPSTTLPPTNHHGGGGGGGAASSPSPVTPYDDADYFHGPLSSSDAEKRLLGRPPGTFLIRYSTTSHGYSSSFVSKHGSISHARLHLRPDGTTFYDNVTGKEWSNLDDLIKSCSSMFKFPCPKPPPMIEAEGDVIARAREINLLREKLANLEMAQATSSFGTSSSNSSVVRYDEFNSLVQGTPPSRRVGRGGGGVGGDGVDSSSDRSDYLKLSGIRPSIKAPSSTEGYYSALPKPPTLTSSSKEEFYSALPKPPTPGSGAYSTPSSTEEFYSALPTPPRGGVQKSFPNNHRGRGRGRGIRPTTRNAIGTLPPGDINVGQMARVGTNVVDERRGAEYICSVPYQALLNDDDDDHEEEYEPIPSVDDQEDDKEDYEPMPVSAIRSHSSSSSAISVANDEDEASDDNYNGGDGDSRWAKALEERSQASKTSSSPLTKAFGGAEKKKKKRLWKKRSSKGNAKVVHHSGNFATPKGGQKSSR